jgi:hypothetical protein
MRSFLIKAGIATILIFLLVGIVGISLAVYGPLLPGNAFFPVQELFEKIGAGAYTVGVSRSSYYLDLVELRINNLIERTGTQHESAAILALDRAIDRAVLEISNTQEQDATDMRSRLVRLVQQIIDVLNGLTDAPVNQPAAFAMFQTKIHTLLRMADSGDVASAELGHIAGINIDPAPASPGEVAGGLSLPGVMVPFPPGSPGAIHAFYPLTGVHTTLQCTSCHSTGTYRGTSNPCEGCHQYDKPTEHYIGACVACHNPNSWQEIIFDHAVAIATDYLAILTTNQNTIIQVSVQVATLLKPGMWLHLTMQ